MFDWPKFLDSVGVDYVLGPIGQVRSGHIGIGCPICGNDDKFHYAIELDTSRVRGCWRDPTHWMSAVNLIAELGNLNYSKAKDLLYSEAGIAEELSSRTLAAQLSALDKEDEKKEMFLEVKWPETSRIFHDQTFLHGGKPYIDYLRKRGFKSPLAVGNQYGLRWCRAGSWSHRLLFPIRRKDGVLVGWTGRDITGTSKIRYKTYHSGAGVAGLVFGCHPELKGEVLALVEGPMDAIKLDFYAGYRPVNAIALLGLNAGQEKLNRVQQIATNFKRVLIVLDSDTEAHSHRIRDDLAVLDAEVKYVPEGVKDPGDMTEEQVEEWWDEVLEV